MSRIRRLGVSFVGCGLPHRSFARPSIGSRGASCATSARTVRRGEGAPAVGAFLNVCRDMTRTGDRAGSIVDRRRESCQQLLAVKRSRTMFRRNAFRTRRFDVASFTKRSARRLSIAFESRHKSGQRTARFREKSLSYCAKFVKDRQSRHRPRHTKRICGQRSRTRRI